MSKRVTLLLLAIALLAALTVWGLSRTAAAEAPLTGERVEQLVYDVWAYSGPRYHNTFYPQSADTLYLIGEVDNVVMPKLTQVYYWPLTQSFRADWAAQNQRLAGTLEIYQGQRLVESLKPMPYVLVYSSIAPVEVRFGAEAEAAFAAYQEETEQAAAELDAYYEATVEYQIAYENYLNEIKAGNLNAERPAPPPEAPPAAQRYVSEPAPAYRIHLPAGRYRLQLRTADGRLVRSSEKSLEVFTPRRTAIGYSVFVGERWTQPDTAADPQATIYTQPGTDLFFQPYQAQEFNQYAYAKLLNPQVAAAGRSAWQWVLTGTEAEQESQVEGSLHWTGEGAAAEAVRYEPYRVQPVSQTALGYEIIPYEPQPESEAKPSFWAFRVAVPEREGSYTVYLTGADGQPLAGSEREVRVIAQPDTTRLQWAAAVPLGLGALVVAWRRYRTSAGAKLN